MVAGASFDHPWLGLASRCRNAEGSSREADAEEFLLTRPLAILPNRGPRLMTALFSIAVVLLAARRAPKKSEHAIHHMNAACCLIFLLH